MNVILIGHRGSGKTSVGMELAARLACPFYDSDLLIEEDSGSTIPDLVETGGWSHFREREREVIRKMAYLKNSVIATGGGAVMDHQNAALLKNIGVTIWLMADAETIVRRLRRDEATSIPRPSLSGRDVVAETASLLAERNPVYRHLACYAVDTSTKGICQVVEEIDQYLLTCGNITREDAYHGG
ncbi:MAG: shikimate kinase [Smithellaceae bacterium]|nr:shikimate kinase [Smithellaceae bacterium]